MEYASLALAAIALTGCDSGCAVFGCDPPSHDEQQSTTGFTTTTTTTTSWIEPASFACVAGNDAACVEYLNAAYMSFDEVNNGSAMGVPIRGRARFEEDWYYCTGQCFQGQPDCYVAASLVNHKVMVTPNQTLRALMDYEIFVIFQPLTALTKLVKCAWQYDGAAFNRNNGGCGAGAPGGQDCTSEVSAFGDKCPENPWQWADDTCGSVMSNWCGSEVRDYPATCFWRGPAWFSPVYPQAQPDWGRLGEVNEIRDMLSQRLRSQSFERRVDSKWSLTEYWNEITMDGRIIQALLNEDASQVVAAFGYAKGSGSAHWAAQPVRLFEHELFERLRLPLSPAALAAGKDRLQQFNDALERRHGRRVPVVSMDLTSDVGPSSQGPFGTEEAFFV